MNDEEKAEFQIKLEARLEECGKTIEKLKESSRPVMLDGSIGRLTRIDAIQAQKVNQALLKRAEDTQDALLRARERLNDPEFGTCSDCGETISFARLMAVPHARRCISCA
jgi:DnaK suppressor protein